MVFSSSVFLFWFLPLTLIMYYAFPFGMKYKNTILVIMSLVFYTFGEPVYVIFDISKLAYWIRSIA